MIFLQPWLLLALPLILLPVVIHLINQWRFQTMPWAAMMFLLSAHRMARGYSRLRQWLIMLLRVVAIAALLLAVSRPLAGGWLGLAAGERGDTTIILLDRSPSMQWKNGGGGDSKLVTGCRQLAQMLRTMETNRYVLIDSVTYTPVALESADSLLDLPSAQSASSSADLPRMMQSAHDYIRDNQAGRTEVWLCSDLESNDWSADSGRWPVLRESFIEFPQSVRFHLLAYPRSEGKNVTVRVTDVRRHETSEGAELLLSINLARTEGNQDKVVVPVQIDIEGSRSVLPIELSGLRVDVKDHSIPIERTRQRGWGKVSIPADANPADDDFYFVFDNPPLRKTLVVADEAASVRPLVLAAEISMDPALHASAETIQPDQLTGVDWESLSLVLWQSSLPSGPSAELLTSFVNRGGQVVFFPPRSPTPQEFLGVHWQDWKSGAERIPIETWLGNEDLLTRTISGTALPVGELEIRRFCELAGNLTRLATLRGGFPLLARVPSEKGAVYFWTTTVSPADSSLGNNGIVLYAFIQRALAAGAKVLGKAKQLTAGDAAGTNPAQWNLLARSDNSLSTEFAHQRGVYGMDDRLMAVNRSQAEDEGTTLTNDKIAGLFRGLDFSRIDDQAGSAHSMIQEIWRTFLMAMLLAIVLEAILCLPKMARKEGVRS